MSGAHSRLGPSSSHRWINCPGSMRLIERALADGLIKPDTPSAYAEEGTKAHELAATMLQGKAWDKFEYDDEMLHHVSDYVEFVQSLSQGYGTLPLVEQAVKYDDWVLGGWGTVDAAIVSQNDIIVIDLKYGRGVAVDAVGNTQLLLYALGVYQGLDPEHRAKIVDISMYIYQPRLDSITEWHIRIGEFLDRAYVIRRAAELALTGDAPLAVGDWCRFCPAQPVCKAQYDHMTQVIGEDFDDLTTPADLLSPEIISKVLDARSAIESWFRAVSDYATERLLDDLPVPGYKLVAGRSVRQWGDEQTAASVLEVLLGDDGAYTRKLLSPAQAEKALGKKDSVHLAGLITKTAGSPTLVPSSDPRPAFNNTSVDDFDNV